MFSSERNLCWKWFLKWRSPVHQRVAKDSSEQGSSGQGPQGGQLVRMRRSSEQILLNRKRLGIDTAELPRRRSMSNAIVDRRFTP
ncbi:hypothetical protein Poly41_32710 [Novipirellula artificiosorum]|uniref:Uncharacterized protein n=1 Tax=Novipirellula artificiosorum TaxID=2528016 RepID=A0A5C6DLY2_9BACT|nr:hypothetical protein Poly41_32710 [Novipirellula artificiosorum]